MTTDWAENRANIPDDWFRKSVGKLIDFAYSSGTRDMFRTQVERAPDGSTDISVTHSAMEEVLTGQDKTGSRWESRPRNPALEAAFLAKIMQKFGLTDAQAKQLDHRCAPGGREGRGGADGRGVDARYLRAVRSRLAARGPRARSHELHGRQPRSREGHLLRALLGFDAGA